MKKRAVSKFDEYGYPKLSLTKATSMVRQAIRNELRPYVYAIEIDWDMVDHDFLSMGNSDVTIYFLPPVVADCVDGSRYVRCSIADLPGELEATRLDPNSIGAPEFEEYDENCEAETSIFKTTEV